MKKSIVIPALFGVMAFAGNGEVLLQKNCASCHMLTTPSWQMIPTLKAPAMDAVVFHIKEAIKDKKEAKSFIIDYVQNPNAAKAVCESNKVQKYGVMPSLKGEVSHEDLSAIADYMLEAYPHEDFVVMIKEVLKNDKMNALQNSPFLINSSRLPHFTKLLIQNWDKAALGLTDDQKKKLLVVRNETLSAIKKLKPQIKLLEDDVADEIKDGESVNSLNDQLKEIAELKTQVTKSHLKCIADTTAILSDEQIEFLLPYWE